MHPAENEDVGGGVDVVSGHVVMMLLAGTLMAMLLGQHQQAMQKTQRVSRPGPATGAQAYCVLCTCSHVSAVELCSSSLEVQV